MENNQNNDQEQETSFTGSKTVSMFDQGQNSWVEVPREQVPQLFLQGGYGIDPEAEIDLLSPDGKRGSTQGKHLQALLDKGFSLESYEESKDAYLEEEYGNSPASASILGAARGLSFGLSDVGFQKLGVNQEYLRETKARNEAASTGGELFGIAAPLLLSGGAAAPAVGASKAAQGLSAAARATKAAGILPRAVARAGIATEKIASKAVQKTLASRFVAQGASQAASKNIAKLIAEKAISKGMGSAVEGAFYGAGKLISEEALGNVKLNAETLLSTVGVGTLFGGVVGASMGVGGVAFNKIASLGANKLLKPIEGSVDDLGRSVDDLGNVVDDVGNMADDVAQASTEEKLTSKLVKDLTPDELRYYRENLEAIQAAPNEEALQSKFAESFKNLQGQIKGMESKVDDVLDKSKIEFSNKEIYELFKTRLDDSLGDGFQGTTDNATERQFEKYFKNNFFDGEGNLESKTWKAKDIRKMIQKIRDDFNDAYDPTKQLTTKAKTLKKLADQDLNPFYQSRVEGLGPLMKDYRDLMKAYEIRNLMKGDTWWRTNFMNTMSRDYYKQTVSLGLDFEARTKSDILKDFGETVGINFDDWFKKRHVFAKINPDKASPLEFGTPTSLWTRGARANISPTGIFDKIADETLGRAVDLGKHGLIKYGDKIGKVINKFSAVEKIVKQQRSTVNDYVNSLLETGATGQAVRAGATSVLLDTSFSPVKSQNKPTTRREAFKERYMELNQLKANPRLMVDTLGENFKGMQFFAPQMATHATQQATAAVNFLHSKLPQQPVSGSIVPELDDWEPSDEEIASFERYVEAVQDPLSVLETAQRGSLTEEYVEAIQTVYPNLYQDIQAKIIDQMTNAKKNIPYSTKIQLGILFNTSTDTTMDPQFINMLSSLAAQDEANPSKSAAQSLDVASRFQSRTDYLEGRRMMS